MLVDYGFEKERFVNMTSMSDRFSRLFSFHNRSSNITNSKVRAQSQPDEKKKNSSKPPIAKASTLKDSEDIKKSSVNGTSRSKSFNQLNDELKSNTNTLKSEAISSPGDAYTSGDEAMSGIIPRKMRVDEKAGPKSLIKSPISVLAPCKGKINLELQAKLEEYHLKIHSAKGLRDNNKSPANSIIYIYTMVDGEKIFLNRTNLMMSCEDPDFNLSFLWPKSQVQNSCRILLMFYHQPNPKELITDNPRGLDFIGCMSFGVKGITTTRKQINGWYYLLNERTGLKKHLKAGLDGGSYPQSHNEETSTVMSVPIKLDEKQSLTPPTNKNASQSPSGSAFSIFKTSTPFTINGAGLYQNSPYILKTKSQPSSLINAHFCRPREDQNTLDIFQSSIQNSPSVEKSGVARRFTHQIPPSNSMNSLSNNSNLMRPPRHLRESPSLSTKELSDRLKPAIMAAQKFNLQLDPSITNNNGQYHSGNGTQMFRNQYPQYFSSTSSHQGTPLMTNSCQRQSLNIAQPNKIIYSQNSQNNNIIDPQDYHCIKFTLYRNAKGFGFTLAGSCPVMVCYIEPNSPAYYAGLQIGDYIIKIDQLNVSRSNTDNVVRMFRMSPASVSLTILRSNNYPLSYSYPYQVNGSNFIRASSVAPPDNPHHRGQFNLKDNGSINNLIEFPDKKPPALPIRCANTLKTSVSISENLKIHQDQQMDFGKINYKTFLELFSENQIRLPLEFVLTSSHLILTQINCREDFPVKQSSGVNLKDLFIPINKIYYANISQDTKSQLIYLVVQFICDQGLRNSLTLTGPTIKHACENLRMQMNSADKLNRSLMA